MKLFGFRKVVLAVLMGAAIVIIGSSEANAQYRAETRRERIERERYERQQERERQRRARNRRSNSQPRASERQINNANFVSGYQQGLAAGEYDRRRGKYNQSNVYRDTGSYPNQGDPTSYDYIYRQGYLEGYNDGFNGRRNY